MRKMRFFACMAWLCAMTAMAGVSTTDKVVISELELVPGGNVGEITVSLEGCSAYSAFEMDLYLPKGFQFVQQENDDEEMVYLFKGGALKTDHSLSSNIQPDGALRLSCVSMSSNTLKSKSTDLFKFFVQATPYAKPGAADIQIKDCHLITAEAIQYDAQDQTISDKVTVSSTSTCPLNISATNQWSTCILPFAASLPSGVKAYSTSSTKTVGGNDVLVLEEASSLSAYTPYILYSEGGYSGSLSGTVDGTKYPASGYVEAGYLKGAITVQQVTSGYVLQNLTSEGVKFYQMGGSTFSIPAGKCWLELPSEVKAIGMEVDTETSINNVQKASQSVTYGLDGKLLPQGSTLQPNHIYIVNGQKVMITK